MSYLIFLVSLAFACVGFFSNISQDTIVNPLYTFYIFEIRYFLTHPIPLILVILVITLLLKRYKYQKPFNRAFQVMILGFLFSSLILFSLAFFELNILTIIYNLNPVFLGINTDKSDVVSSLKTYARPPNIIVLNPEKENLIHPIAVSSSGKENYYGKFILTSIPDILLLPLKNRSEDIALVNETLIIKNFDPDYIQDLSPYLGYLYVKSLFPGRNIKYYPHVFLENGMSYQKYREKDFAEKIAGIEYSLGSVTGNIASSSSLISDLNNQIKSASDSIREKYRQADSRYLKCLNTDSSGVCEINKNSDYQTVTLMQNQLAALQDRVKNEQNMLDQYHLFSVFYQGQKNAGKTLINNIPLERGAFDENENIYLNLDLIDIKNLPDYFDTLVHEYLHYASFISKEKKLSSAFFEEGLTEYYARLIIKNNFQTSPNIGYPVIFKIISKIAKNIPDSDLADIYFNKDEKGLETALNRIYGDNFYQNNRIFFEALQYTSDPGQLISLANVVMEKIGGEPLTQKDLLNIPNPGI